MIGRGSGPVDGTLVPWVSDGGKAMQIAAASPTSPGPTSPTRCSRTAHTLDYVADAPYLASATAIGVMKQSFVAGLYGTGLGDQQLRAARAPTPTPT